MKKYIEQLVEKATSSFAEYKPSNFLFKSMHPLRNQLQDLLSRRNGFFAFDHSLRLFPACNDAGLNFSLEYWNSSSAWVYAYGDLVPDCIFFGDNIFGEQYSLMNKGIYSFDPETAKMSLMADSFEEWAKMLFENTNYLLGHNLALEWQTKFGPLDARYKLIPKIPFVCGGAYEIQNLFAMPDVDSMAIRGSFALQTHDLPDGAKINFKFID